MARGNTQHAARLYERVMQVPLKDLQSLFKGYVLYHVYLCGGGVMPGWYHDSYHV